MLQKQAGTRIATILRKMTADFTRPNIVKIMKRNNPFSIFTITLILVYWCASIILSPFPYWVSKVVPVSVEHQSDQLVENEVCCTCGMGSGCTMPCCIGKKNADRGLTSHSPMNHHEDNAECDIPDSSSLSLSGAGCGCLMQVPPADVPIEYLPVYGRHYYYPTQYAPEMPRNDALFGSMAGIDSSLSSLCEITTPSPPPKSLL